MRPEKPDLMPERPDLRPIRSYLRPEWPDLRPERPGQGGDGQTDGWTDRRMDGWANETPCVLQDFVPFGAAVQKGVRGRPTDHPIHQPSNRDRINRYGMWFIKSQFFFHRKWHIHEFSFKGRITAV